MVILLKMAKMIELLLPALLSGLLLAVIAAPLGCFVVWRQMAYFSDTLAHSALLGIAIGFLFDINLQLAVIVFCLLLAISLLLLERLPNLASDTLLGILAHSSLALGIITISTLDNLQIDLMAYLFGDILATRLSQLSALAAGTVVLLLVLGFSWPKLVSISSHEELARVEGVNVERYKLLLMLMLAIVVAAAMHVVGVLLISALFIIPAASARRFANSPEAMAIIAMVIACGSVVLGLAAAYQFDFPAGPSIVAAASLLFITSQLWPDRT